MLMTNPALGLMRRPHHPIVNWPVPRPRRFTVLLGLPASLAVASTSLRAISPQLLVPLVALWLTALVAGALWTAGGPMVLTVLAGLVKALTIALVVWRITHPSSPIGPHGAGDWVPLGLLNAATGIWFLRVIRHQAA
jgi:hypothetical protein